MLCVPGSAPSALKSYAIQCITESADEEGANSDFGSMENMPNLSSDPDVCLDIQQDSYDEDSAVEMEEKETGVSRPCVMPGSK